MHTTCCPECFQVMYLPSEQYFGMKGKCPNSECGHKFVLTPVPSKLTEFQNPPDDDVPDTKEEFGPPEKAEPEPLPTPPPTEQPPPVQISFREVIDSNTLSDPDEESVNLDALDSDEETYDGANPFLLEQLVEGIFPESLDRAPGSEPENEFAPDDSGFEHEFSTLLGDSRAIQIDSTTNAPESEYSMVEAETSSATLGQDHFFTVLVMILLGVVVFGLVVATRVSRKESEHARRISALTAEAESNQTKLAEAEKSNFELIQRNRTLFQQGLHQRRQAIQNRLIALETKIYRHVVTGWEWYESGDETAALVWFTQALKDTEQGVALLENQPAVNAGDGRKWNRLLAENQLRVASLFRRYPLQQVWPGNRDGVFHPKGTQVATVEVDGNVRLRDMTTGQLIETFPPSQKSKSPLTQALFDHEGSHLLALSADGQAQVWQVSPKVLRGQFHPSSPIRHVAFSIPLRYNDSANPQEVIRTPLIVTVTEEGTVSRWNTQGELVPREFSLQGDPVALSRDGRYLLVSNATCIELYDLMRQENDAPLRGYPLAENFQVTAAAISDDGEHFAFAVASHPRPVAPIPNAPPTQLISLTEPERAQNGVELYSVYSATIHQQNLEKRNHPAKVNRLKWSGSGHRLLCGMENQSIWVWNEPPDREAPVAFSFPQLIVDADLSFNGNYLTVVCRDEFSKIDGDVQVWDVETGEPACQPWTHPWPIQRTVFHPTSNQLLTISGPHPFGETRLWDVSSSRETERFLPESQIFGSLFFEAHDHCLVDYRGDESRAWDVTTGRLIRTPGGVPIFKGRLNFTRFTTALFEHPTRMKYHATPEILSTGGLFHSDSQIDAQLRRQKWKEIQNRLEWEIPFLPPLPKLPESFEVIAVDRDRFITQQHDPHAIRVWDLATGFPLTRSLLHPSEVVAVKSNGGYLATQCRDGHLRVWSIATSLPVTPPRRHEVPQILEALSSDGRRLVSKSFGDGEEPFPTNASRGLILWDFGADVSHSADQLHRLAQRIAAREIDATGELVPLNFSVDRAENRVPRKKQPLDVDPE